MDFIRKLSDIENSCTRLGHIIRNEGKIFSAELEDRQRLGLHGDDAIQHFNEWMIRFGLLDMVV